MATNRNPRQDTDPMKQSNASVNHETKQRRSTKRRDVFRGPITGFIDVARNGGDVTAYSETVYMGNAEGGVEPPQVPRPKARKQDREYAAEEDFKDEQDSSGDDGPSGAVFYGAISGFVREARGAGDATALKKVIHVGTSNGENYDPRGQQGPRSQEENEIVESRNIAQTLAQEPVRIRANNFPRTTERQHTQQWADSPLEQEPAFDMNSLTREYHKMTPEMKRFVTSLAQRGSDFVPTDDER